MQKLYSLSLLLTIPLLVNFCSETYHEERLKTERKIKITVKCIDGENRPIGCTLVYEQQDCEFDFNSPSRVKSSDKGIATLPLNKGYLQLYAENFLHESYRCGYYDQSDTITIYAAAIPTIIRVLDFDGLPLKNETVSYFPNLAGDCLYEENIGAPTAFTNSNGLAKIYLPFGETYKIQTSNLVQCFQPIQQIDTLTFTKF